MRAIFVNSADAWGGNEKWTVMAAEALQARGHQVRVICRSPVMRARCVRAGLETISLRMRGNVDIVAIARLRTIFGRFGPDVVVLTKVKEYWLGALAARWAGTRSSVSRTRPVRVFYRLGLRRAFKDTPKYRFLLRYGVDGIIVNSTDIKTHLLAHTPRIPADRIHVVYNGVPEMGPPREDLRERWRFPPDIPLIGAAGRLARQKGFDFLLRTFAEVRGRIPDARLVIAGEGSERRSLEALTEELGFADSVLFPGFCEDMVSFFATLDLFVLSSREEGLANVLLEAMASGLPAVATDVSGTRETVIHGETGYVVPFGACAGMAERIGELLEHPDLARKMGAAAQRRISESFSASRMADALETALK